MLSPSVRAITTMSLVLGLFLASSGTVLAADNIDPTIGLVEPTSATVGQQITFTADVSDNSSGVAWCELYVEFANQGLMSLSGGKASKDHTFSGGGVYTVFVRCGDAEGNTANGPNTAVVVTGASNGGGVFSPTPDPVVPPTPEPTISSGLVKLACPDGSTASHPCRSVYYRDTNGTRHAFPNDKIYFTWYENFSDIEELSATELAALPLGQNVTYRPGVRMVKFVTENKVYALSRAGLLRWIASEDLARALYGSDWNTKIDDLSDAFAADYSTGPEIMNVSDYSYVETLAATDTIDENF